MKVYHEEIEYELYITTLNGCERPDKQKLVLIQFKHRTLATNEVFLIVILKSLANFLLFQV